EAHWAEVDAFAMPTISITPPTVEELKKKSDPNASRNTSMVNLLRLCAVSMPVGLDVAGMPIGLQLAAPTMGEERLLAIAAACERVWGTSRPRLGVPPMCKCYRLPRIQMSRGKRSMIRIAGRPPTRIW